MQGEGCGVHPCGHAALLSSTAVWLLPAQQQLIPRSRVTQTPPPPAFIKVEDAKKKIHAVQSLAELQTLWKDINPSLRHHLNKGELDELGMEKDAKKAEFQAAAP